MAQRVAAAERHDSGCRQDVAASPSGWPVSRGLEHRVFHSFEEARDLRPAWRELALRDGDLFSSYEWCRTWWRHYGQARRLEIHTFRRDGQLVGVLPLFRQTLLLGGVRLRVARLVGSDHTLDAAGLAIRPDCVEPFLRAVLDGLDRHGPWDLLHLGPLRHYVSLSERIRDACAAHAQVQAVIHGSCDNWITQFDLPASYDDYLEALQPVDRKNLRRRERHLQARHAGRVRRARDAADIQRGMDDLVRLHRRLWVLKGEQGVFQDWPQYESFHREAAGRLAEQGHLILLTLEADGQAVGAVYGYHFGSRTHSMISGYHEDAQWRSLGIGRLLHCQITRQAIESGTAAIDDGRGVFEHKIRFGGHLHGERSVAIVRRGWGPRVRVWAGMRVAYALHVLYCRLWFDRLGPRLQRRRPLRRFYIRSLFLAQLFRRARFRLIGGPPVQEARREAPPT